MKRYRNLFVLCLYMAAVAGCKKYDIAPLVKDPAYIRVFNDLATTVDVLHTGQAAPFLTFLLDPKIDAGGQPSDAAVIGDYLGTRQLFSLSYPINGGNSSIGNGTIGGPLGQPEPPVLYPVNYEYPGNAHVLTAPVINGFDLSSWAQVPSGTHRIMFVVRPQNGTGFKSLSAAQRSNILLDTTLTFEKGEVYTLEVISHDLDNGKYGLYVRKEQFIHQAFEKNKLYAGFVNLSGKRPVNSKYGGAYFFPEKVRINCTYNIPNDAPSGGGNLFFTALPGYDKIYYNTLTTKRDTVVSYFSLPLLPESAFFYQGILRQYGDFARTPVPGTMPYVKFDLTDADWNPVEPYIGLPTDFSLSCNANPATYNNYNPNTSNAPKYPPNLNLIVNTGNAYHVYSTLNILEMVYDRIYLMQIQRGFDEVPKN